MSAAETILELIDLLRWPVVVSAGLVMFRGEIRSFLARVTRVSGPGVELEAPIGEIREGLEEALAEAEGAEAEEIELPLTLGQQLLAHLKAEEEAATTDPDWAWRSRGKLSPQIYHGRP